jgi:NADH-quinone oxidoreductase subunit C
MADTLFDALKEKFGDDVVVDITDFRDEQTFVIDASNIYNVCEYLKNEQDYTFLADITGVDYYPTEPRFALNYHLLSMRKKHRLRLKVYWTDGEEPIPSVYPIWRAADWEEREAYDMFGIEFSGHPDMRRLLMPDDWQGFPQRKDYPLGYETVQFSFNVDEVNQHKPYAKE